jgi:hypothetical protein
MPHEPPHPVPLLTCQRLFAGSRHQARFLATAFEAACPLIRRRLDPSQAGPEVRAVPHTPTTSPQARRA